MIIEQDELRQELLATLGASRELSHEDDEHLVDALLQQLQSHPALQAPPGRRAQGWPSLAGIKRLQTGELLSSCASAVLGMVGVAGLAQYLQAGLQGDASLAVGQHSLVLVALLLVGLVLGAVVHSLFKSLVGLALLLICTVILVVGFICAAFLPNVVQPISYGYGVVSPIISVLTVALAVVASTMGVMDERVDGIKRQNMLSRSQG